MTDQTAIRAALDIGDTAGVEQRVVDITTTGGKSGEPRRIEIPPLEDWVTFSPLVEVSFDAFPA